MGNTKKTTAQTTQKDKQKDNTRRKNRRRKNNMRRIQQIKHRATRRTVHGIETNENINTG